MRLLEVGPGNGTYTRAAGERLEERGLIVALDIEMRVAARLKNSMDAQNLRKVFPVVADVHLAPFTRQAFDAVYMVAVIGEIPGAEAAFHAFYDVLKPGGKLLFSELLLDPDYTLPRTLRVWAQKAGFEQAELHGGLLSYTVLFQRPA